MFTRVEDLEQRNELVQKFLKNRSVLREKVLKESLGKQRVAEQAEELQKPVTEKLEENQQKVDEKQNEVLRKLDRNQQAIVQSIQNAPAIMPPQNVGFDPDHGLHKDTLHSLQLPLPSELLGEEISVISDIQHTVAKRLQSLGGMRRSKNKEKRDGAILEIEALKPYHDRIKDMVKHHAKLRRGEGIKYYTSSDELVERLYTLCGSKEAGNNAMEVDNEIVEILTRLLKDKVIDKKCYKSITEKYL